MAGSEEAFPPSGLLMGGNTQELVLGAGGHNQTGFDRIMARFDKLEFGLDSTDRRVDNLEAPAVPDPDPPYFSDEAQDDNKLGHRALIGSDLDTDPRFFIHGRRIFGRRSPQTSTVAEYHDTFEHYLNRVEGLSELALIPIFITGLKEAIQENVELQQPSSLAEAMALALPFAASRDERHCHGSRGEWHSRDSRAVTHVEEKWAPRHVCKQKILSYVGDEEHDATSDQSGSSAEDEAIITVDLSHLHALSGSSDSRPFNIIGAIGATNESILIDTGSTHDFLHPRIAEQLQLALTPIRPFCVYVGNGASLICSHVAWRMKLSVQGIDFLLDLHIMEIHGPDIVLGMAWLESFGKISADFVGKTLEFQENGIPIALRGVQPTPRLISLQSLAMLAAHSPAHEFYETIPVEAGLLTQTPGRPRLFRGTRGQRIQQVLEQFHSVFSVLSGMPPRREFDHRIHLLPNAKPVNARPYRYPYFQKNEIEWQVQEILDQGYHQIRMHEADVFKTAFRTHDGHFEFSVMPFGLTNALSTFQAAMNGIFQPLLRKCVIVFFDDILVYSSTLDDHCRHLAEDLSLLQAHNFFVKLSKCSFCSSTVEYLGHLVSDGILKADPTKIDGLTSWPQPKTVKHSEF
ncbi:uncharacterized protein LOC121779031 [Salvia splendens]|uniref:uncharacterized protein LOC121779031 n=1 Tax=Salvia splendens TaxID=180675 RepID=UPI001C25B99B|nr:uncharacterized protein LOC121779031 [Salvia splendens]